MILGHIGEERHMAWLHNQPDTEHNRQDADPKGRPKETRDGQNHQRRNPKKIPRRDQQKATEIFCSSQNNIAAKRTQASGRSTWPIRRGNGSKPRFETRRKFKCTCGPDDETEHHDKKAQTEVRCTTKAETPGTA